MHHIKNYIRLLFILIIGFSGSLIAESVTVFKGYPAIKIIERGSSRDANEVLVAKAPDLACVISNIDGKFYWASRENVEVFPMVSGAFTTYLAINGSGYVRVSNLEFRAGLKTAGEGEHDYVEHLLLGLNSITSYGRQIN